MNRLTISLPNDLYAMARAHAVASNTSISGAIADLLRRRTRPVSTGQPVSVAAGTPGVHPLTGFPLIQMEPGTSMEDIQRALEDEDRRHLEMMSPREGKIEAPLNS